MTVDDLWEEYRQQCCLPETETSEAIHWQRQAFIAGVCATIGNILMRDECFEELRQSVIEWMAREYAIQIADRN